MKKDELRTEEGKSSRYIDLPALGLMLIRRSIRKGVDPHPMRAPPSVRSSLPPSPRLPLEAYFTDRRYRCGHLLVSILDSFSRIASSYLAFPEPNRWWWTRCEVYSSCLRRERVHRQAHQGASCGSVACPYQSNPTKCVEPHCIRTERSGGCLNPARRHHIIRRRITMDTPLLR